MSNNNINISTVLRALAAHQPQHTALIEENGKHGKHGKHNIHKMSYAELEKVSDNFAYQMQARGIKAGDKVLIFLLPKLNFPIVMWGLFKLGAIPVLLDPGMGVRNLLASIAHIAPLVLITEPKGILLRLLFAKKFCSTKLCISTKKIPGANIFRCEKLSDFFLPMPSAAAPFPLARPATPSATSAILFTSGGTGIPKGVVYTHEIFHQQIAMMQQEFKLTPNDIDLPGFPFFALFTLAMGVTIILPPLNPSKPAQADPQLIVDALLRHQVSFAAGSPAIWSKVANYCTEKNITIPSMKSLLMFGAPVDPEIHRQFSHILTNGTTYTPYGATEALPLTNITGKEILQAGIDAYHHGAGMLVGRPWPMVEIRIMEIDEHVQNDWSKIRILPCEERGEIIVSGPTVTSEYCQMPEKTALAKIYQQHPNSAKVTLWHRMGDLGYLDQQGRLWFCGRKDHLLQTRHGPLYPIPCEAIFNQHQAVFRSALIGIQEKKGEKKNMPLTPAIVIERKDHRVKLSPQEQEVFENELISLAKHHAHTAHIAYIFYHPSFPVDVRHNIKIDRQKLQYWAQGVFEKRRPFF
ncbi:MAG: AMP-binding protein [Oligoflexia bacterium]|nr:AMP-binding protein [Oligoflexia bacterium]